MTEESVPEAVAEPPPREESVGETLARARAALGFSIEECAQQLKFSSKKIEALEQERFDLLPGGTFARGMVRAYARLLKLDAEKLVARVAGSVQVPDTTNTAVSLRPPIPFAVAGKRGNLVYVVLSVAALIVVAWVAWGWQQERSGTAKLSFVPAAQVRDVDKSVVAVVTLTIAPIQQERTEAAKPAAEAPAPLVVESATGKHRIVLRFAGDSWVEIRGSNGRKLLVSQVHAAGTERVVDGDPPFSLVIGNAQNVRVIYGEKPVELAPHVKVDVARLTLQ